MEISPRTSNSIFLTEMMIATVLFFFFAVGNTTFALDGETWLIQHKQELKQVIASVKHPLMPVKRFYKGKRYHFCNTLLQDFIAQNEAVKFIAPVVTADNYPDKAFEPYQNRCQKLEFNKFVHFVTFNDIDFDLPEKEFEEGRIISHSTQDFRLYHFDVNQDNTLAEDEYVFYSDIFYEDVDRMGKMQEYADNWSIYVTFDLNKCKMKNYYNIVSHIDSPRRSRREEKAKKRDCCTGLLEYKNQYYEYHLYFIGQNASLSFEAIKTEREYCSIEKPDY